MIKFLKYFALLMLVFSCKNNVEPKLTKSKTKLGIGLIYFNLSNSIPLYMTDTSMIPYDTIHFETIKDGIKKGCVKLNTSLVGKRLIPSIFSEGDSEIEGKEHIKMGLIAFSPVLAFVVTKKNSRGVEVIINQNTCESSFIRLNYKNDYMSNSSLNSFYFDPNFIDCKIDNWFYFRSWEEILKTAYRIEISDSIFFEKPLGKRLNNNIFTSEQNSFNVDSVSGEWARVFQSDYNGNKGKTAWVKWKIDDKLQVGIVHNGGYE